MGWGFFFYWRIDSFLWTIKKTEHQENWFFWIVVLKTLESPLVCREDKPVNPKSLQEMKPVHPEYSLKGLMQKFQYSGHLMPRANSLEKTLIWGKIEGNGEEGGRGWDGWMASSTQWTWVWASSGSWWWTGKPSILQSMGSQKVRHYWATELTDVVSLSSFLSIFLFFFLSGISIRWKFILWSSVFVSCNFYSYRVGVRVCIST